MDIGECAEQWRGRPLLLGFDNHVDAPWDDAHVDVRSALHGVAVEVDIAGLLAMDVQAAALERVGVGGLVNRPVEQLQYHL